MGHNSLIHGCSRISFKVIRSSLSYSNIRSNRLNSSGSPSNFSSLCTSFFWISFQVSGCVVLQRESIQSPEGINIRRPPTHPLRVLHEVVVARFQVQHNATNSVAHCSLSIQVHRVEHNQNR